MHNSLSHPLDFPISPRILQGAGGSLLSNGTWTGVMGELTSGRADLSLFPLTLTSARAKYISATVPYLVSVECAGKGLGGKVVMVGLVQCKTARTKCKGSATVLYLMRGGAG